MGNVKKILIIKTGALGDIVLASPSFNAIHQYFPEATLSLLTRDKYLEIVEDCPGLKEIYTLKNNLRENFQTIRKIRNQKFSLTLDLQGNLKSNILSFLSAAESRIGLYSHISGRIFLTRAVKRDVTGDVLNRQFFLLKELGIKTYPGQLNLWISDKKRKEFENFVKSNNLNKEKKWIIIHPSSSPEWLTKRWPQKRFAQVADFFIKEGYAVILVGDETAGGISEIISLMEKEPINLAGKTNFAQLALLLERSALLLTTDSGPLHTGVAAGTKVLALFGPTDPKRHCPATADYIYHQTSCGPCYKKKCSSMECLSSITVEEVIQRAKKLL